jgi:hypothetical protein
VNSLAPRFPCACTDCDPCTGMLFEQDFESTISIQQIENAQRKLLEFGTQGHPTAQILLWCTPLEHSFAAKLP